MKIHYGSGNDYKEGRLNVDLRFDADNPDTQLIADITKQHPFKDSTASFVYCQDVL